MLLYSLIEEIFSKLFSNTFSSLFENDIEFVTSFINKLDFYDILNLFMLMSLF